MNNKEISFNLTEGQKIPRTVNNPRIFITGKGCKTYIWIGNDTPSDKHCFATLSGMKTLESLAFKLLRALGHTPGWLAPEKKKPNRGQKVKRSVARKAKSGNRTSGT